MMERYRLGFETLAKVRAMPNGVKSVPIVRLAWGDSTTAISRSSPVLMRIRLIIWEYVYRLRQRGFTMLRPTVPADTPLLTALATAGFFIGSIFTPWAVPIGAIPVAIALTGWFWPKEPGETGTQQWPITKRTLPLPDEAPSGGTA